MNEQTIKRPSGTPLELLVQVGDTVKTSYGTGGVVAEIRKWSNDEYGDTFSIHYETEYSNKTFYLNNYVAVEGRILSNCSDDEIFVIAKGEAPPLPLLL